MPLNDYDKDLIQAMFRDNCNVQTVLKVIPHVSKSTLYFMQKNFALFGVVRKLATAKKASGAPRKITPVMREYLIDLLAHRNDLWLCELVFELWCKFNVAVDKLTMSRLLAEDKLTNKVNTRIASRQLVA
jgi:transposase